MAASASRFPLPASRFPLPASRFPLPASRFPLPASRFPLPASRFPREAGSLLTSCSLISAVVLLGLPIGVRAQNFSESVKITLSGEGGGPSQVTNDPSQPNLSVADDFTYPVVDWSVSGSLSTSQIGIFHGSVSALYSPTTTVVANIFARCQGILDFSVIALNDSTTPPSAADIQILQSLSGKVTSSTPPSNLGPGGAGYIGFITVTDSKGGSYNTSKQFGDGSGGSDASDSGPINVTLSQGDMLNILYSVDADADFTEFSSESTESASANFDAMVGYIAPPGWGLYLVNPDSSPGLPLNEFPDVPESSSVVSFGLLLALGLGGVWIVAKRKKASA